MDVGFWLGLLNQILNLFQFGGEVIIWKVSCGFDLDFEWLELLKSMMRTFQVVIVIVEDWFLKDMDVLLKIYELIFLLLHLDDRHLLNLRI